MRQSEQINELATALAKAQGSMDHAAKDRTNPGFKAKYATLASVIDACRHALAGNGIAVMQPSRLVVDAGVVEVDTMLVHSSGQWIAETLAAAVSDGKAQTIGSAITYLRRYGLSAIVGVAPDDDDGNAASGRPVHPPPAEQSAVSDETKAALRKAIERYPHAAADLRRLVDDAPADALARLREACTRLGAEERAKAAPATALPRKEALAQIAKIGKARQLIKTEAPSQAAAADSIVAAYAPDFRLESLSEADLAALLSELDGLYTQAVAA